MTAAPVDLRGVAQTLLAPLYARALESQRPDALLHDDVAVALVAAHPEEFAPIRAIRMADEDRVALVLRNLEVDAQVTDFLRRHEDAAVVHVGCGLDRRFERLDDGHVVWFDLDLPEVTAVRARLAPNDDPRYHLLAGSVLDDAWTGPVAATGRAVLVVAEGVLMYLDPADVRGLVAMIRDRLPGSELVTDAFSPLMIRLDNLRLRVTRSALSTRYAWGLGDPHEVERWAADVRLLGVWSLFGEPRPRLRAPAWRRRLRLYRDLLRVVHYRLG